jgi:hypothetical protein
MDPFPASQVFRTNEKRCNIVRKKIEKILGHIDYSYRPLSIGDHNIPKEILIL